MLHQTNSLFRTSWYRKHKNMLQTVWGAEDDIFTLQLCLSLMVWEVPSLSDTRSLSLCPSPNGTNPTVVSLPKLEVACYFTSMIYTFQLFIQYIRNALQKAVLNTHQVVPHIHILIAILYFSPPSGIFFIDVIIAFCFPSNLLYQLSAQCILND